MIVTLLALILIVLLCMTEIGRAIVGSVAVVVVAILTLGWLAARALPPP